MNLILKKLHETGIYIVYTVMFTHELMLSFKLLIQSVTFHYQQ